MKVEFKVHTKQKLAECIWELRNSFPEENLSERSNPCIYMDFSKKLIKNILESKKLNVSLKKEIIKEINFPKKEKENIKDFIKNFKPFWNSKIESTFFIEMKKIFTTQNIRKKYICYPTKKVTGMYFGKNEITTLLKTKIKNNMSKNEFSSMVLAEEILHLIYWEMWERIYNKKIKDIDEIFAIEGPKWSCWHIAEIIPEYLLIQNPAFKKFNWGKDNRSLGYHWIPKLKKILDPVWKESENIKEFIIKSHERVGIKIKSYP